ncbi:MAG: PrsW family intramembrane metalloprotease [Anaerolineae bacterium]|nr:PrsW family intramembrane metalloprotease [Anaerolineae bacterium]
MDKNVCCVCHQPVAPGAARQLGGRTFCERHYAKATQDRRSFWRAGVGLIVGQVVFVLLVELLVALLHPTFSGAMLVVAGLGLALISALIWLVFFYLQDRLEPEPKGYILMVFLLGALLAQAVDLPLLRDVFEVQRWIPQSPLGGLLGSILVVGFVQEFLKYIAVRYSVYPLPEFDERIDGVIYGTAAGLGYATMLNLNYVVSSGGVNLQVGVIRIVVTALAQASFAGLSGYFLGRAKFEEEPIWWLPGGVALAATLNGVFTWLRGELTTTSLKLTGGGFNPWPGLILATIMALGVLGALYYLMRRASAMALINAGAGFFSDVSKKVASRIPAKKDEESPAPAKDTGSPASKKRAKRSASPAEPAMLPPDDEEAGVMDEPELADEVEEEEVEPEFFDDEEEVEDEDEEGGAQ